MVTCIVEYGLPVLLLLLFLCICVCVCVWMMIMVMVMYADANVYFRLHLFIATWIFMYEMLRLCDDYYVLVAHVFKS